MTREEAADLLTDNLNDRSELIELATQFTKIYGNFRFSSEKNPQE